MALVVRPITALSVETGEGLAYADSYLSVADSVAYHTARGNTAWLGLTTTEARERALRLATDHMTQTYRALWKGCRVTPTQRLDWPRTGVQADGFSVASHVVPREIGEACAELALRVLKGSLSPDIGPQATRKTIGPITVEYAANARQSTRYSAVDALLRPFLGGGLQIKTTRA